MITQCTLTVVLLPIIVIVIILSKFVHFAVYSYAHTLNNNTFTSYNNGLVWRNCWLIPVIIYEYIVATKELYYFGKSYLKISLKLAFPEIQRMLKGVKNNNITFNYYYFIIIDSRVFIDETF